MTIEEEFMNTFGIEKTSKGCDEYYYVPSSPACSECEDKYCLQYLEYPKITDRILLELICIMNQFRRTELTYDDYEGLKKQILMDCYGYYNVLKNNAQNIAEEYKHQVRSLFEVEE